MRRVIVGVVALLVLLVAAAGALLERGEVVVLETRDGGGGVHETRVWIVDHDGFAWLRTGDPNSPWLARLRENPEVAVTRGGERRVYRAIPSDDPATRDRINALVLDKYGLSERVLRVLMLEPDAATPIRLEPR